MSQGCGQCNNICFPPQRIPSAGAKVWGKYYNFPAEGEVLVNSKEYAGTVLHAGEFILQAIGSKYEILAMTDVECVCYRFSKPEFFCEDRYNHIMKEVTPPLIFYPWPLLPSCSSFWKVPRPICPRRRFAGKYFVSNGKNLLSFLEITTPTMSFPCWYILLPSILIPSTTLSCRIMPKSRR